MAKYLGTVAITGPISPSDTQDIYATHSETFGHGGYKSVDTLIERDEILPLRRKIGMVCYVSETDTEYRLKDGIENTNWDEIVSSGGGDTTRIIVGTLGEMVDIPLIERTKGLMVYVQETDQEYRLMKGIEDINWVLVSDPVLVNVGSTEVIENENGTNTIQNNYSYNTNNYYLNKIGCLNKLNILNKIYSNLSNIGTYKNSNGIVVSTIDVEPFSFYISSDTYWINNSIHFFGSSAANIEPSDIYINIKDNGVTYNYVLSDIIGKGNFTNSSGEFNIEIFGNEVNWNGYLNFKTIGPKEIKVYQITNDTKTILANTFTQILIFSPNFIIYDGLNTTPSNIIEGYGISFTTKNYTFKIPTNSTYTVSLVKVGVTTMGINTSQYDIVPNTTQPITDDMDYVIQIDTIRSNLVDGNYALLVKGYENGIYLPEFFYGPFTIALERI